MAIAVPSRLWLGGVISAQRDRHLIQALVQQVRASAVTLAILVCVDGLASYVSAFRQGFRHRVLTGQPGRPRLEQEQGLLIDQVIKQYTKRHVSGITRRIVQGSCSTIAAVLEATHTGSDITTAYIERLNATFRGTATQHSRHPLASEGQAVHKLLHSFALLSPPSHLLRPNVQKLHLALF